MRTISTMIRAAFMAVLLIGALAPSVFAQTPPSSEGPSVKEIEIQFVGPSSVSRERILANMRTAVGKVYSPQVVEEDIQNLYATQSVSNLRIFSEPSGDGVKVVVVVQTRSTVKDIAFQGVEEGRARRLRKEITTKPGAVLDDAALEQDRQKIVEYYSSRGYGGVDVQYKVNPVEGSGQSSVVFSISEGGKQVVRKVIFEGNISIPEKELRKSIKTRPPNLLSVFNKSGRVSAEQMDADVVTLEDFYRSKGYADVSVAGARVDRVSEKKVDVVFTVKEGPLYKVGKSSIQGNVLFTEADLRAGMKMGDGSVYSPQGLASDIKSIQDLYGTKGYVDLTLIPETTPGGPQLVDISYKIDEGVQSYIQRINIEGNSRTKDKVIRRELAVTPGDLYNTVLVDVSKRRLENLNYFSKVETFPSETFIPGRKDLNVQIEEKRTGSFNFGAGFSSIDSLLGFVEVQQSNFDITKWPDFQGGGQRFRVRVQYGTKRKDFILGLTEPWFMDRQIALGGEIFYREATYVSDVYDETRYGATINLRKPINNFTSARLEYRIENISIEDVEEDASEIIKSEEGDYLKSAITASLTNDTRDSIFLSRSGHKIDASAYLAGGFLGGDLDTFGLNLEASQYFSLPWDTILQIVGEVGVVNTWGDGERVPIFDRLYLGGANTLRGFDYRDVGPKDENGEPIGGSTLARLTVEYTFPVVNKVRGAVFYDVGFVSSDSFATDGDLNSNVGIGLRIELPALGPVRLDFGIPVQSDTFNDSGGKFNFNVGYQF